MAARSQPTLRIFVGCTSVDLHAHRDAVRREIEAFDEHPVVMGDFGARDGDATTVSLERVRSCDVYILLLAWRYGTVPSDAALSITHQEYRAAKDANIPRLIFLADPATERDDGPTALFPAAVRDPEHAALLRDFRDEVSHDRVIATFTTPDNAAAVVAPALHHLLNDIGMMPRGPRPPLKLAPRAPEFVGRTSELADLCQRLRSGQSVGLSALVAGMGGVGKSALAAEALAQLAADPAAFPGGATFVRCDGREGLPGLAWLYDQLLADWGAPLAPEQIAQAQLLAQTAGPAAEVELRERALQAVLSAVADGPALVLLDNVEVGLPLARALETLTPLGITALVTARHRPAVARLTVVPLDVLDPPAAVELFAERYREKGGNWDDTRDTASAAAIVERLGRLPLAIELQAARAALRQMTVSDLNADLARDRSQGLLGDPLDATRNLRYSFDQSLRTLTPLQRTRFAALGLPGGPDWPRDVIVRLLAGITEQDDVAGSDATDDKDDDEPSANELASAQADLDLLAALSLVIPAEGRIRLHPLLHDYAQERWRGEPPAIQESGLSALLAGIYDMADEYEHDFAALAHEEEMVVAALDQAQASQAAPRQVIAIVDALNDYLDLGGHWNTGMRLRSWQLVACRVVGDRRDEGRILNNLGTLARRLGQPDEARRYYEQALAIRREVGDRAGEAVTLSNRGLLADGRGQKAEAKAYYEQALAIQQEIGARSGAGITLNNLGALADDLGQKEQARSYYEQALAILQEVGNRAGEGSTLNNLGELARSLGQLEQARDYYEQALAITREVGNRAMEGTTLNNLGTLTYGLGQPDEARDYYEQALVIRREVGDRAGEGTTLNNLGLLANHLGQPDEARDYYEQALVIFREVGDRHGEETTLGNLGVLSMSLGRLDEAARYFEQDLGITREVGDRSGEGTTLNNLGGLARSLGQSEQARDYYEQALAIHREVGNRAMEGTTLNNLGGLAYGLGQPEQTRRYFEQALAIFEEIGAVDSVRVVTENLAYLDAGDTASGEAPRSPAISPEKALTPKRRRWPWQRKRTN
ncbi:MAG TPA: tetratricopeptide repeat protein [Ktedonobacterales bacterium]|jgi:tetratricopeptide (TPR) repeat protein